MSERGRKRKGAATLIGLVAIGLALVIGQCRSRSASQAKSTPAAHGALPPGAGAASAARPGSRPDPHLAAKARITGHVRDGAGATLPDADVCASFWSKDLGADDVRLPRCVRSAADGAYALTELLPAEYSVSASAAGKKPSLYREPIHHDESFRLRAGEARDGVDLVLDDGGVEVHGKVKDISGGVVAGALVIAHSGGRWGQGAASLTRSDAQGEFVVWTAPGEVWASAEAEGYSNGWTSSTEPGRTLEILLTPESVLVGRVVEAGSERPVAHARVGASSDEYGFGYAGDLGDNNRGESVFTDENGHFRIERLAPGRYKPVADAPGLVGVARASVLLGLGQTSEEVIIEEHPAATVSGVLLAGGKPCSEGSVQLRDAATGHTAYGGAEAAGAVTLHAVLPGHYKVSASCSGFPDRDDLPEIDVAVRDVGGFTWELTAGYRVSGTVVDAAGAGVAGADIYGQSHDADPRAHRRWAGTRSEKDGSFLIEGVAAGTIDLQVEAAHHPTARDPVSVEVHGDVSGVKITLGASGAIEGVVEDEDGKPVAGVDVNAQGKTWDWANTSGSTRDDGGFRLDGLQAGEYRVTASQSWTSLRAPGTGDDDLQGVKTSVHDGATARVKLRVESRRAHITGRVVDSAGKPVPDAYLDAQRESESAAANAAAARGATRWGWTRTPSLTDPEGHFQIDQLTRGKYTVHAYRKGGGEAFAEHVATGANVTITIATPGSISGTVVNADGSVPEELKVAVSDRASGFGRHEAFFRVGGAFTMSDLPAGKLTVTVEAAGGQASTEVVLADGEQKTGVRLTLTALVTLRGTVVALDTGKPLAGFRVSATALHSPMRFGSQNEDEKNVSDAGGHFEVPRVPAGRVRVMGWPLDYARSDYGSTSAIVRLEPGHDAEIPPLRAPRRRLGNDESGGDLGFTTKESAPDAEPEDHRFIVAVVRPGGPAAAAGMQVGDEIVTIEGNDVTGVNAYLAWSLEAVPEGTTVTFGVKRGDAAAPVILKIVAGKASDG
jgi:protocatechuate 3,4-dioxygenase beta subunit